MFQSYLYNSHTYYQDSLFRGMSFDTDQEERYQLQRRTVNQQISNIFQQAGINQSDIPEKATVKNKLAGSGKIYTMTLDYNGIVPNGNEGEVTVAVKENAVQDVNGNGNAYTSNTTKIDRIAPIFISLEANPISSISLDKGVDTVKQYYKAGDKEKSTQMINSIIESDF